MLLENTPSGGKGFTGGGGALGYDTNLSITDTNLDNISPSTFAFWVRPDSLGSGGGRVYAKATTKRAIYIGGAFTPVVIEAWSGGVATWTFPVLPQNLWSHISVRLGNVAGSVPVMFVNGSLVTTTVAVASSGTLSDDVGPAYLLDRSALAREIDGVVDDFQWFDRYLTDDECSSLYLRSALRCQRLAHDTEFPETLTTQTVGFIGPWEIVDGTWTWGTDTEITNVSLGTVYKRSKQAYGAWYYKFNKPSGGRIIDMIIASLPDVYTATGQDGYMVYIESNGLLRIFTVTNGAAGATPISGAAGTFAGSTDYEIFIVRDTTGLFSFYARGGVYSSWTLIDTGTENTHTSSLNITTSCNLAHSGTRSDYQLFPYGMGLTPDDILWLAD